MSQYLYFRVTGTGTQGDTYSHQRWYGRLRSSSSSASSAYMSTINRVSIGLNRNYSDLDMVFPYRLYFDQYITYRSYSSSVQFPKDDYGNSIQTGHSLDIWSNLKSYPNSYPRLGYSGWGDLLFSELDGEIYTLNSSKFTIVYDYETPDALFWSKGGVIQFDTSETTLGIPQS